MLRSLFSVVKSARCFGSLNFSPMGSVLRQSPLPKSVLQDVSRSFCFNPSFGKINTPLNQLTLTGSNISCSQLLRPSPVLKESTRNVIKFSLQKGKRKTVHVVLRKFFRLNWGCWIHGKCGRQKRLYKKSASRKRRLQYHVMCNGKQSMLLDKMVTRYWRKPKYYVDDPYEPYHSREEYKYARLKPFQPFM